MRPTTSRHPWVTRTVTQGVTCLVCSTVTAADYLKVTTVKGRGQEHGKLIDEIVDGWNRSFFDQVAGMCRDEVEKSDLNLGVAKGLETIEMSERCSEREKPMLRFSEWVLAPYLSQGTHRACD